MIRCTNCGRQIEEQSSYDIRSAGAVTAILCHECTVRSEEAEERGRERELLNFLTHALSNETERLKKS